MLGMACIMWLKLKEFLNNALALLDSDRSDILGVTTIIDNT